MTSWHLAFTVHAVEQCTAFFCCETFIMDILSLSVVFCSLLVSVYI